MAIPISGFQKGAEPEANGSLLGLVTDITAINTQTNLRRGGFAYRNTGSSAIRLSERRADSRFPGMRRCTKRVLSNEDAVYTAYIPVLADADGCVVIINFAWISTLAMLIRAISGEIGLRFTGSTTKILVFVLYGAAAVVLLPGLFVLVIGLLRAL